MNKGNIHKITRFLRRQKRVLSMLLAVIVISSLASGCQKTKIPDLAEPDSGSIQGMQVEKKDIEERMILTGYVAGDVIGYYYKEQKVNLEYKVKLGEKVTKGQILVVADTAELEERMQDLNNELAGAKADLNYQGEYGELNEKKLSVQKKNAPKEERESAENELERAKTDKAYQEQLLRLQISNLNKEMDEIKEQIEKNILYAEGDGYVSYISYTQYTEAFENVVVVTGTDSLHIALEDELPEMALEQYVRAYIISKGTEEELKEIAYTEEQKKVAEKSNMILTPKFELVDKKLSVGDYVTVFLVMEESKNTCVISKSCVYQGDNGSYAYRIEGKKKEKCFLETGVESADEIEIISGLSEEDMVYYPVDETVKYEGKQEVKKETVYLKELEKECRLYYPDRKTVNTGVEEAELTYIADTGMVQKGDLLAKVSLSTGKADIKEIENQISSLRKQYQSQKSMHEKTVKLLKKEIQSLQSTKSSASSPVEPGTAEGQTVEKPGTEEQDKPKNNVEEEGKSTSNNKIKEEETKEDSVEDKTKDSDHKYPTSVKISIKKLELSMERLAKDYDEKHYNHKIKQLTRNLERMQKRTGEVSVYTKYSGTFEANYITEDIGRRLVGNAELGLINDDSITYLQVLNKENILRYGNQIAVKDQTGAEYTGSVAGAYSSGTVELVFDTDYGETTINREADENQENAYLQVSADAGLEEGTVIYRSAKIEDVIAIDKKLLKKEELNFYVWVLKEGKPFKQYVEFNNVAEDKVWIIKGLSDTDTLLTGVK